MTFLFSTFSPHCSVVLCLSGLDLLRVIEKLRDTDDEELQVQYDVFLDEKAEDEELLQNDVPADVNVDLSDPRQVFDAIYCKVIR